MDKKRIILALIKDHLISTKLVEALNGLGMSTGAYCLNIGQIIVRLMNYPKHEPDNDELTMKYNRIIAETKDLFNAEDEAKLKKLAVGIYKFLLSVSNN